jgi:hypothetical protein
MKLLMKIPNTNKVLIEHKGWRDIVDAPPFEHEEIVTTSKKHYSHYPITMVLEPTYVPNRGWIYGQKFFQNGSFSGGQCWWNEAWRFEKITDPKYILIARKLSLKLKLQQIESERKAAERELSHITHSLNLIEQPVKEQ